MPNVIIPITATGAESLTAMVGDFTGNFGRVLGDARFIGYSSSFREAAAACSEISSDLTGRMDGGIACTAVNGRESGGAGAMWTWLCFVSK